MNFPTEDELKKTVTIRYAFFKLTQDVNASLLLSQLHYWSKRTSDKNGWVYKTQRELEAEIFLTPFQQRRARQLLVSLCIIEEKCVGLPKKLHFRIKRENKSLFSEKNNDESEMKELYQNTGINTGNDSNKAEGKNENTSITKLKKLQYLDEETSLNTNIEETTTKITKESTTKPFYGAEQIPLQPDLIVFNHWKTVMKHPAAKLDKNRSKLINGALNLGYSVDDLCLAISGCSVTPHNIGDNDKGQRYDGLHIILKNADQIDRFMANYINPPRRRSKSDELVQNNLRVLERWTDKSRSKSNGRY